LIEIARRAAGALSHRRAVIKNVHQEFCMDGRLERVRSLGAAFPLDEV
jgi:hypothetical protein